MVHNERERNMIVFRCSHCSKVNISAEGYHCSHCDNGETRVSSIHENSAGTEVVSNATNGSFLHMQNISTGNDFSILPQATDKCNGEKFYTSEEKNTITLDTSGLHFPTSQGEDQSMLNSFEKDGINVNQLKGNKGKANFSELLSNNSTPTFYNFQDHIRITKASAKEIFPKGCIKNDLNEKLSINIIKTPILKKPFLCNKCGKSFTNESKLRVHFIRHFKQKRFKCDRCDKKYFSEARLKKHYKSHMAKVPFICNLWDLVFLKNSRLHEHRKKHILETAVEANVGQEELDKSQQREQEAIDKEDPQKHLQSSTEEKIVLCTECGTRFIRESDFKAHSLRHSAQKPFKCNECNKWFRYESHLNSHYSIHSQERLFICKMCGFSSTHGNAVNRHLKWCQVHS